MTEIEALKKKLAREQAARIKAEQLLEEKAMDLYQANVHLQNLNKSLESKIDERTTLIKSLIKNLQAGVLVETADRKIYLTNETFCQCFNVPFSPEELIGLDCSGYAERMKGMFAHPDEFVSRIDDLLASQEVVVNEEIEMADGRILERDFVPIFVQGSLNAFFWNYRDVTEKKKAEITVKRSEEKYRGIIENMELGLMEVDTNQRIQKVYEGFCEMTGYKEEELIGKDAIRTFLPSEFQQQMAEQDKRRNNGKAGLYEIEMRKKNGDKICVLISGAPFYDLEGNVIGSVGIHYDITDRKQLEKELIIAKKEADFARNAEKKFLADMSHEIRNPLNAVIGMTNLLYDTEPNSEQIEYLNAIKHSSDILLNIISDVLDISKIEAGETRYNPIMFNLKELCVAMANTFKQRASEKNLGFEFHFDEGIENNVIGDQTIINQVLVNLLSNALKFTDKGSIGLHVQTKTINEDRYAVEFVVSDTGIGIKEENTNQIFESFRQEGGDTKLKYGGTGLGLAISKELVKLHKGRICVQSIYGKGSAFTLALNLQNTGIKPRPIVNRIIGNHTIPLDISRALIVEDNKINQNYLSKLLSKWNIKSKIANNGLEGLEYFEKDNFDVVFMDIRMPEMDGYEAVIRMRAQTQNPNSSLPIIALTASAMVEERDKALRLGFDYHVTKPFSPDQLLDVLLKINPNLEATSNSDQAVYSFNPAFDADLLEEYYSNDLDYMFNMFGIFLKNTPGDKDLLTQQFHKKNWREFGRTVHKMKSTFSMVGFPDITNLCDHLETKSSIDSVTEEELLGDYQKLISKIEWGLPLVSREREKMSNFVNKRQPV